MSPAKIKINGREYDSPEAMPPEERRLYEQAMRQLGPKFADQDGNGIPDVFEGKQGGLSRTIVQSQITVNGKTFRSADEMPPDVRKLYEDAMARAHPTPGVVAKENEFHFSFGISTPTRHVTLRSVGVGPGTASAPTPPPAPDASPIGSNAEESRIRGLLVLLACGAAVGYALWVLRPH